MGFVTAPKYALGPGAIEQLSALDAQRPLVLRSAALGPGSRGRRVVEELAKRDVAVAEEVVPAGPPTPAAVEALAARVVARAPDWIVAVGGGRVQDLARAAWIRYARPMVPLADVSPLTELALRSTARFVAVPTTSGAGAEASPTLHLRADDGGPMRPSSRELLPEWVLLDPSLAATVPVPARADAGAIALGHALESMASAWSQPFSDALARGALATLARALPMLARAPEDDERAAAVHVAAGLAGLASANAQDGVAAALAGALSPALELPYGRCVGIVLPYVLEFNYPSARDLYQSLGPSFGDGSIVHRSDLAQRVRAVLAATGIPKCFADAGVGESRLADARDHLVQWAGRPGAARSNPRVPSDAELGRLIDAAYRGDAVAF